MMSWYHKNNLAPFYESHLDVVRGAFKPEGFKEERQKEEMVGATLLHR